MKEILNSKDIYKFDNSDISLQQLKKSSIKIYISFILIIGISSIFYLYYINNEKIKLNFMRNLGQISLEIDDNDNCFTRNKETSKCLSCYPMLILNNGICEPNYSIKAIYKTNSENQTIDLISELFLKYINEMSINNTKITPQSSYKFKLPGTHTVYILIDITSVNSINYMFSQIKKLTSISFTNKFDSKNVKSMINLFYSCNSLTSVDLSNFNSQSMTNLNYVFQSCSKLIHVNFKNFNTTNVETMNYMFKSYTKITSIDLSSFDTKNLKETQYIFFLMLIVNIFFYFSFSLKFLKIKFLIF